MLDNDSVNENDPTKPLPPAWESGGNKQGKLVIGSFHNSPMQPYQYPQPQQPTVPA